MPCTAVQLWKEESGALKPLQRAMPPEQAKVRTTIRRLVRAVGAQRASALPACG